MKYPGYRSGGDGAQQNDETIVPHDLENDGPRDEPCEFDSAWN